MFPPFTFDPVDRRYWRDDGALALDPLPGGWMALVDAGGTASARALPWHVARDFIAGGRSDCPPDHVRRDWERLALTCPPLLQPDKVKT